MSFSAKKNQNGILDALKTRTELGFGIADRIHMKDLGHIEFDRPKVLRDLLIEAPESSQLLDGLHLQVGFPGAWHAKIQVLYDRGQTQETIDLEGRSNENDFSSDADCD